MIIPVFYIAICLTVIAASICLGPPDLSVMVCGAAVLVAIIGVPHGGLDHWTGRRLLASRFSNHWWLMFFPGYLTLSFMVAILWHTFPIATVVGFFLVSAWHFGREDQYRLVETSRMHRSKSLPSHLSAIALGGLVIWIPALVRPEEMEFLLRAIVPGDHDGLSQGVRAATIVSLTSWIAMAMCPLGLLAFCIRITRKDRYWSDWVALATACLAALTPILISFTAFFCLWHSILGLTRLKIQEGLTARAFVRSILPLSALAIAGVAFTGFFVFQTSQRSSVDAVLASLQTLFIGLSAIAVPHLLLHEWAELSEPAALNQGS